jgi:hypothetical protein
MTSLLFTASNIIKKERRNIFSLFSIYEYSIYKKDRSRIIVIIVQAAKAALFIPDEFKLSSGDEENFSFYYFSILEQLVVIYYI